MRQRLLEMQGVSNLEELMEGRRTSSMGSAQRQLNGAMNQLKELQAQKSINEAKLEAGEVSD